MQNISDKFSRNKIQNEKIAISKEIEDAQMKKANLLLEMGIRTYEKIRNGTIVDEGFDNICNEILEIDTLIYNSNIKIKELDETSKEVVCECGSILNTENKFCGTCGKKVDIINNYLIECKRCDALNEEDSIYCVCCGNRLKG